MEKLRPIYLAPHIDQLWSCASGRPEGGARLSWGHAMGDAAAAAGSSASASSSQLVAREQVPPDLPLDISKAYADLKLQPGAKRSEIRRSYLKLALQNHPDRQGLEHDGDAFRAIKAAYEIHYSHFGTRRL